MFEKSTGMHDIVFMVLALSIFARFDQEMNALRDELQAEKQGREDSQREKDGVATRRLALESELQVKQSYFMFSATLRLKFNCNHCYATFLSLPFISSSQGSFRKYVAEKISIATTPYVTACYD